MKAKLEPAEFAKRNAALAAVQHVKDSFVVGLGSGSTAAYAIEAIGERMKTEKLRVLGVPTSYQAFQLAVKHKIPVTTLEEHPVVDLDIDGADQVDPELNLIKGMGAALTREKIVAAASKLNIIVADKKKKVKVLGEGNHPVPVEAIPFAISLVQKRIEKLGGTPVLRESKGKLGPVISDNGNAIIDAVFGPIKDAAKLERELKMIPGVVETGLFIGLAGIVYFGTSTAATKLEKERR